MGFYYSIFQCSFDAAAVGWKQLLQQTFTFFQFFGAVFVRLEIKSNLKKVHYKKLLTALDGKMHALLRSLSFTLELKEI